MPEFLTQSVFFGSFISLFFYEIGLIIKRKLKFSIFNPLLIAIILTIIFLAVFHIDYETYNAGAKYISFLLTPATICLAIPLYEQFSLLKKHYRAVLAGIVSGVLTSLLMILAFSIVFHFSHEEYISCLPKSITTAIGIGISEQLGGNVPITVAVICITGLCGNILAVPVCKLFRVTDPIAVGVGIGTASHAVGTSKAIELGEIQGAMSGLSLSVAGILTVFVSIVFSLLY